MLVFYLDCFSGTSGDVTPGAAVEAGADPERMKADLPRLPVSGRTIRAGRVRRKGIAATNVHMECAERHPHRGLTEIPGIIGAAGLAQRADRSFASARFSR
jgi:hypothetical protein